MSFMRGEPYIWTDGEDIHIWSNESLETEKNHYPSRVKIKKDKMEELAVMILSRMSPKEIEEAEKRAVTNHSGNSGCMILRDKRHEENEC